MSDEATNRLASALEALNATQTRLCQMVEVLVEAMPAKVEGEILGISQPTVRRNRAKRRNARLLQS